MPIYGQSLGRLTTYVSKCAENIWEGIHKGLPEKSLWDQSYPENIDWEVHWDAPS